MINNSITLDSHSEQSMEVHTSSTGSPRHFCSMQSTALVWPYNRRQEPAAIPSHASVLSGCADSTLHPSNLLGENERTSGLCCSSKKVAYILVRTGAHYKWGERSPSAFWSLARFFCSLNLTASAAHPVTHFYTFNREQAPTILILS